MKPIIISTVVTVKERCKYDYICVTSGKPYARDTVEY